MKYLVIDQSVDSVLKKYADRYKLFGNPEIAEKFARSIGFEWGLLGGSFSELKPGVARIYQCGEVNITILALEEVV